MCEFQDSCFSFKSCCLKHFKGHADKNFVELCWDTVGGVGMQFLRASVAEGGRLR